MRFSAASFLAASSLPLLIAGADASLYLLSDYASYITGEVLTLDGGAWLGRGILGAGGEDEVPTVRRRRSGR